MSLPAGGSAAFIMSDATPPGGRYNWSASGGQLKVLAERATLTSASAGKITVTVNYTATGEKTCSKCSKSIVVSFLKGAEPESMFAGFWNDTGNDLAKHKNESKTAEEFSDWAKGISLKDLIKERGNVFLIEPGEDMRYVQDPANPDRIIDMRHFMYFGEKEQGSLGAWLGAGQISGVGEEFMQWVFRQPSAFDPQDLYSNALGAQFFHETYSPGGPPLSEQLREFFKQREVFKK